MKGEKEEEKREVNVKSIRMKNEEDNDEKKKVKEVSER